MEILILLLVMTVWMGICVLCIIAGIFLATKRQIEITSEPMSEEAKRKKEQHERELQNFLTYNGDEQSR